MKTKFEQNASMHPLLEKRWSPRGFRSDAIPEETIASLFEAARWAPSSFNEQPWRFVYATKDQPEAYQQLANCIYEKNREWAAHAYLLIVAFARQTFARNGKPNRHAGHDVGQAIAHLTFQATAEGLFVHQMGGFSAEKVVETYEVGEEYVPMTALAVGFLGDPDHLSEDQQASEKAPQKRHAKEDWLFNGEWPK